MHNTERRRIILEKIMLIDRALVRSFQVCIYATIHCQLCVYILILYCTYHYLAIAMPYQLCISLYIQYVHCKMPQFSRTIFFSVSFAGMCRSQTYPLSSYIFCDVTLICCIICANTRTYSHTTTIVVSLLASKRRYRQHL